jgi:hypothetical protein
MLGMAAWYWAYWLACQYSWRSESAPEVGLSQFESFRYSSAMERVNEVGDAPI